MAPQFSRRDFLKISAASISLAVLAGCQNPRRWVTLEPYVRPPEEQLAGMPAWFASTCRQCPAGCGILVRILNGRAVKIEGNPEHPLNQGKLCARGQAGLQVLYNPDRLAGPVRQVERGSRKFQSLTWEEALNTLYSGLLAAGSRLVFWLGSTTSGHLYDLFRRFAVAVGAPAPLVFDLYTAFHGYSALQNSRNNRAVPGLLPAYDLGQADAIFSFGADFLGTWLSATRYGIEFGKFRNQPLGKRGYLVQFEPRMSPTGAKADRWLPIRPGTEAIVAQAITRIIADQPTAAGGRAARARALAPEVDVREASALSDVSVEELTRLAHIFASVERPIAIPGVSLASGAQAAAILAALQGLNQIAGMPEQSSESLPEALTTSLIHPDVSSIDQAQQLIERMSAGQVQALFVYGANPAYDLPESSGFVEALARVPLVVSFAPIVDETAVWADLILPDRTPLESWGYEVVYPNFGMPVISGQQPVVEPVYDNRSTGDVLLAIARGIPEAARALPWADEIEFIKEMIGGLPPGAFGGDEANVRFARFQQHGGWWPPAKPVPANSPGVAEPAPVASPVQFEGDAQEYPFYLHLIMSNLLSDGRGANQPWLQGSPDPNTTIAWQTWVEINPQTARSLGIRQGDVLKVASPFGTLEAPAYLYPAIRPDTIAIPLGQGHTDYGRYARARGSNAIHLLGVQKEIDGGEWIWRMPRVQITPTGRRKALATFEYAPGIAQGFINQDSPGQ